MKNTLLCVLVLAFIVAGFIANGLIGGRFWPGMRPRVLLIGVDGMDWEIVDRLIAEGRLPHLATLKKDGVAGPLLTLTDIPLSPVIWTSVATGKTPSKHGITWFLVDTPDGKRVPVRSHNRRVKAIWNILADAGKSPGVVGWWATAPAEMVGDGVIVTDGLGYHGFGSTGREMADAQKVYPSELFEELAVHMPPLQQIDHGYAQRFFNFSAREYYERFFSPGRMSRPNPANPVHLFQEYIATSVGYTEVAKHLLESHDFDALLVYYESPDSISHLFMKYAPPRLPWVEEEAYEQFKNAVDGIYVFIDEKIGELLSQMDDDWAVFIMSDHGFRSGANRPKSVQTVDIRGAHLDHEPEGIFIASGPRLRRGATFEGGSVLDVLPTVLHYLGLPVATDMDGRVLEEIFETDVVESRPIRYVTSYEGAGLRKGDSPSRPSEPDVSDEALAQLRTLGYVGSAPPPVKDPQNTTPTSPEQHNNLGRIHLQRGDLDAARREFQAALEVDPENAEALTNLGLAELTQGNPDGAFRAFQKALEADPNNVSAILQLAELRQSRGELALAEQMYRQALAIDARLPRPYIGLGDVLQRQEKREEAKRVLTHAAELDPKSFEAHYNLGVVHISLGDREDGAAALERALEIVPDHPLALNNLGHLASEDGRLEEALELFRRAARSDPRHVESRYNLGTLLLKAGELEEATQWLEEAVELKPDLEPAHRNLALVYLESGNARDAKRRYEVLVRMFPQNADGCIQLARIALRTGDKDEAVRWLRVASGRGGPEIRRSILEDADFHELDLGVR